MPPRIPHSHIQQALQHLDRLPRAHEREAQAPPQLRETPHMPLETQPRPPQMPVKMPRMPERTRQQVPERPVEGVHPQPLDRAAEHAPFQGVNRQHVVVQGRASLLPWRKPSPDIAFTQSTFPNQSQAALIGIPHGIGMLKPWKRVRKAALEMAQGADIVLLEGMAPSNKRIQKRWKRILGSKFPMQGMPLERAINTAYNKMEKKPGLLKRLLGGLPFGLAILLSPIRKRLPSWRRTMNMNVDIARLLEKERQKAAAKGEKAAHRFDFIHSFRSYLMAHEIMLAAQQNPGKKIAALYGWAHSRDIAGFVSDASLRRAYFESLPPGLQRIAAEAYGAEGARKPLPEPAPAKRSRWREWLRRRKGKPAPVMHPPPTPQPT